MNHCENCEKLQANLDQWKKVCVKVKEEYQNVSKTNVDLKRKIDELENKFKSKNEYNRDYYEKNRDKILEKNKQRYYKKSNTDEV